MVCWIRDTLVSCLKRLVKDTQTDESNIYLDCGVSAGVLDDSIRARTRIYTKEYS